jgi:hypothetical protein
MFLLIGLLIGVNLFVRITIGESRELRTRGQSDASGKLALTPSDVWRIAYRGGLFLLGAAAIGFVLDLAFNSTVGELFG